VLIEEEKEEGSNVKQKKNFVTKKHQTMKD
jgi:hypothetical protein